MDLQVDPQNPLKGEITVPGDKSITHRAFIIGSLAKGTSILKNFLNSTDCLRTKTILNHMGVEMFLKDADLHIQGIDLFGLKTPTQSLDCGNSGTTLRMIAGVLSAQSFSSCLQGDESLMKRPMKRIVDPLNRMGFHIQGQQHQNEHYAPLYIAPVSQPIVSSYFEVHSAQVKSCLLLASLCAQSTIQLKEMTQSRDHTERMLALFGADIEINNDVILLKKSNLEGREIAIPGCLSSAAFFITAASMIKGAHIYVKQVGVNSRRLGFIHILKAMGAHIEIINMYLQSGEYVADIEVKGKQLKGIEFPREWISSAIDEFPILFIACAYAQGTSTIRGIGELRVKESDRIESMTQGLKQLGVEIQAAQDTVIIQGASEIEGGEVDSFGDHRIAMSFLMAAFKAKSAIRVRNCKNIDTSFPNFVEKAQCLGLEIQ